MSDQTHAERVTDILWRMLSAEQDEGEDILEPQKADVLTKISEMPKEVLIRLDRILLFYQPRWVAANAIQRSDCPYAEIAADNERLIALTSIIDFLATEQGLSDTKQRENSPWRRFVKRLAEKVCGPLFFSGSVRGFTAFLEKYISDEFRLIRGKYVMRRRDQEPNKLRRLRDAADYLYHVRSLVVHGAELGGVWPFDHEVVRDAKTGKWTAGRETVPPRDFRLLLWRAIFRSFGLEIVRW